MTAHPDPLRLDGLSERERRDALEHLRTCADCRLEAAKDDPTRLFSLLAALPVPRGVLDRVSDGVAAAVREGRPLPVRLPARRIRAAAAWAAAAALAAALLVPAGGSGRRGGEHPTTAVARGPLPRAGVEVVSSSGVPQVVDLTVGETQLVMIFDPRLEL